MEKRHKRNVERNNGPTEQVLLANPPPILFFIYFFVERNTLELAATFNYMPFCIQTLQNISVHRCTSAHKHTCMQICTRWRCNRLSTHWKYNPKNHLSVKPRKTSRIQIISRAQQTRFNVCLVCLFGSCKPADCTRPIMTIHCRGPQFLGGGTGRAAVTLKPY